MTGGTDRCSVLHRPVRPGQGLSMSTMPTRSTAGTPLENRARGDELPENVLLDIFDAYRQDIELRPAYEDVWNSRDGWFKLAHVCRSWRQVVLSSPSRLHLHLLFTPHRSSMAIMLNSLPPLPILIDYCVASWTEKDDIFALAAIRHHSRVRGIALRRPYKDMAKFLGALSCPFPGLESLEICPPNKTYSRCHDHELILPATFLSGSAPCLRQLTLREVVPECLSPLLSSATGLSELTLTLRVAYTALPGASLIANLQRLSNLRRLELSLDYWPNTRYPEPPEPPASAGDAVLLSKLTHLIFTGHILYLQPLVVGLAAPSLQHLDATLCGQSHCFPIPHLCKFICDTECQFTVVRLTLRYSKLTFCAGAGSQSIDDQPFKITIPKRVPLEQLGQELSRPLSTVEELVITWETEPWITEGFNQADQWSGFCCYVPQVKTVRISAKVALDVAHSFLPDDREPALDFLPALERVEVFSVAGMDHLHKPICDAFEPLIVARQRVGRSIRLSWPNSALVVSST
ncbi:hypothetical protein EDB92DRAFT_199655 [Lactarius akahatsu]|uniref:F-box domain-containing protein n=1 Tax=Lactarius akahatsu TaxID=416441 RepID=A0AAD4LQE8_9AGAM|nr:hypothetical protein EDB92DRAFT_199655 [Lactarius akahatsu]